jgi:nicotinate-nucleotide adenylyltransferase
MHLALFGGTFDPVHLGHMALAQAAEQQFDLKQVHFIPAYVPPHKPRQPLADFEHRYAMVVLATADKKNFLPSLLEAPHVSWQSRNRQLEPLKSSQHPKKAELLHSPGQAKKGPKSLEHSVLGNYSGQANYSIDTVRRFKRGLGKSDRLFFLIGIDAFLEIATWKQPEALLAECEFIVGSRPGHSLADVANALPPGIRPNDAVIKPFRKQPAKGELVLGPARIHLLDGVNAAVSATQVRGAASQGKSLGKFVPPAVADYIKKMHLYRRGQSNG